MINIKNHIAAIVFCLAIFCGPVSGQEIWPGDVNNNGVVSGVDLLYWGVAFGNSGAARDEVSTAWQGVPLVSPWQESFPNGLNYAYADCDGNGIVDEDDFDKAINDNFGLTHGVLQPDGYANGQPGAAPRLRLQPDAELVGFGATVSISLSLDDLESPVNDFYGLALKLSYTRDILAGDDGLDFDFTEGNWIEADNSYVQDLFVDNQEQGQADLAISRTNRQSISANPGEIGRFSIVIEDIIVGKSVDTFRLQIDSVMLIGRESVKIPVVPDTVTILVAKDSMVTSTSNLKEVPEIKVFPNPVSHEFYLASNVPISRPRLVDNLGRTIPLEVRLLRKGLYRFQPPELPNGMYWLSANTPNGWIGKKIILINQ